VDILEKLKMKIEELKYNYKVLENENIELREMLEQHQGLAECQDEVDRLQREVDALRREMEEKDTEMQNIIDTLETFMDSVD
jgi:SMC interacting uncharacterized protein involved in chromosome segregation